MGLLVAGTVLGCNDKPDGAPGERPAGFWFADPEGTGSGQDAQRLPRGLGYAPGYKSDEGGWSGLRTVSGRAPVGLPALFASGHEAAAFVLSADGGVVSRWDLRRAGQTADKLPPFEHPSQEAWRALVALPDGGLLAVHEGLCLLRMDAQSRVLWASVPGAHHDVCLLDTDRACVLDRARRGRMDGGASSRDASHLSEDGLAVVSLATGEVTRRVSLIDALLDSRWAHILDEAWSHSGIVHIGDGAGSLAAGLDPLHANGLQLVPGTANGSLVQVFLRDVGALVRVNLERGEIESLSLGPWTGAHDPQPVPGRPGWWALFDNYGVPEAVPPRSRVIMTDGATTEPVPLEGPTFYSPVCGAVAPIPGGGWLVTSTTEGRALGFDASGALSWEFRTPFRIKEEGLIAALLDMRPLEPR